MGSLFSAIVSQFTAASKAELAGLMRVGKVTTATSVTVFASTDLTGQDDDAFAGWYVAVLQADNAAPEGELKPMSDYASSTGTITHTAFTQQLAVGDWVVLLRPEIAVIGRYDTGAATGAVTTTDPIMAYIKQIVTNTETLTGGTAVGAVQIAPTTIDLNQGAGAKDLLTGTSQDVLLESLIVKMPTGAAGGSLTSIAIQTDDATNAVFINATDGAVANLTSEAELYWTGNAYITVGTKIQLTIGGGAHGSTYTAKVVAKYRTIVAGGTLA